MTKAPVTKPLVTEPPAWLSTLAASRAEQPKRPLFLLAGQSNAGWPLSACLPAGVHAPAPLPGNHRFSLVQHSANGAITQLNWTTDVTAAISALSYFTAAALIHADSGQTDNDWLDISYPGSALAAWTPAADAYPAQLQQTMQLQQPVQLQQPTQHWHAGALWQQRLLPALQLKPSALIWYQGEQDAMAKRVDADGYQQQLQQWLHAVRQHYAGPIIAVQLAGFGAYTVNNATPAITQMARAGFAAIRQAQLLVFAQQHPATEQTQLVSAADLGHASNIHLGDKQQLGKRLAAALEQKAPLATATLNWELWQLVLPPGNWQRGRLTAAGTLMLSTQPNEVIPLIGWLQDGTALALSAVVVAKAEAAPAAYQSTQRWQICIPAGIHASQISAIAYGWANQPDLNWYLPAKDVADQTLYWPLLPQRWQRGN